MSAELNINQGIEIRDAQRELHGFRLRLAVAGGFVLLLFLLLAARFFYLQVVRHGELHTLAEANRISVVPVVPNRGVIVDRNGVVLVDNRASNVVAIDRSKVRDADERKDLLTRLSVVLGVTPDVLEERYGDQRVSLLRRRSLSASA